MITVYTQDKCTRCNVLKKKMDAKNIQYVECDDINTLIAKKIDFTPMLEIDNKMMDYSEAIEWVNGV